MTRSFVGLYFKAPLFAVVLQLGVGTDIEDPAILGIESGDYSRFVDPEVAACLEAVKQSFDRSPKEKCEIIGNVVELEDGTRMTLTIEDLIVAKTKSEVNAFCQKRAWNRYMAQDVGIAAREQIILSGIPPECVHRVAVYGNFVVSLSDFDLTTHNRNGLAAEIMGLMARLHTAGVVHSGISTDAFGLDPNGQLQIGRLGSATPLLRNRRGNVQLIPDAVEWIKTDWAELAERVLPHILGETELSWAMLDNAERSSFVLGRPFDYHQWIRVLREEEGVDFERVPHGHLAVGDTQFVAAFNRAMRNCVDALPEELPLGSELGSRSCPSSAVFSIAEHGHVQVVNPDAPEGDFHGKYGMIFKLDSPRAIMKVYYPTQDKNTLCSEKSMLHALDGFMGVAPRHFAIFDRGDDPCKMRSFVMERMGNDDIEIQDDVWDTENPIFYKFVARVLEILQSLHDAGILHGDLHLDNMKIGDIAHIENSVSLIDFGFSIPYVDEAGRHLLDPQASRREDMRRFAMEFSEVLGGQIPLVKEFRQEMELLGREERPDYGKWIDLFRIAGTALD